MTLLLVRHASAGDRARWTGDDRLRQLDEKGWRQARGLVQALAEFRIERLLSSPYVRCAQTLEPLGEALELPVELAPALAEGSSRAQALALLDELGSATAALCTHRDFVEALVGFDRPCKKGSVWVFEPEGDEIVPSRYIAPPK